MQINQIAEKELAQFLRGEPDDVKRCAWCINDTLSKVATSLNSEDLKRVGRLVVGYSKSLKLAEEDLNLSIWTVQKIFNALSKPEMTEEDAHSSAKALEKIYKSVPEFEKKLMEKAAARIEALKDTPDKNLMADYAKRVAGQADIILGVIEADTSMKSKDKENYRALIKDIKDAADNINKGGPDIDAHYKKLREASEDLNYALTGDNVPVKLPEYDKYVEGYALSKDEEYKKIMNVLSAIKHFQSDASLALHHHDELSKYEKEKEKLTPALPYTWEATYQKVQEASETHNKNLTQLTDEKAYGSVEVDGKAPASDLVEEYGRRLTHFKKELEANRDDIESLEKKIESPSKKISDSERSTYLNFSKWMTESAVAFEHPDVYIPMMYYLDEYRKALNQSFNSFQNIALNQYYSDVDPLSAYDFNLLPQELLQ